MPVDGEEREERRWLWGLLKTAAGLAVLILGLKLLGPMLAPFLPAWLTASLLEPVVRRMTERFGIRRGFASGLSAGVFLFSALGLLALGLSRGVWELYALARELPERLSALGELVSWAEARAEKLTVSVPPELKGYLALAARGLEEAAASLPGRLSAWLLGKLGEGIGRLPQLLLFAATYAVGVFFLSAGYPEILAFFRCQLPPSWQRRAEEGAAAMRCGLGKWLKAQLRMAGVMALILLTSFLLLGVASPLTAALLTALVDALPVLGVGTVLLPWALWEALSGGGTRALGLGITWLFSLALRSFLEPRLVGRQSGLHPAAALLAAYAGFRLGGVAGLVGLPVFLVMLKELGDCGVLRLWRSPGQKTDP